MTKSAYPKEGTTNIANFNRIRAISILFLITIVGFIAYLIFSASSFPYDGKAINIAGRQRMLSQKITKNVAFIGQNNLNASSEEIITDLQSATKIFGDTLIGFNEGGMTRDAGSPNDILLKEVTDPALKGKLQEAVEIWSKVEPKLKGLNPNSDKSKNVVALKNQMAKESTKLLGLMNDLTVGLEAESAKKNRNLLIALLATLVLTLIYFFYIVAYSFSKLKAGERSLNQYAGTLKTTNDSLEKTNMELSNMKDVLEVSLRDSDEKSNELSNLASDLNRLKEESDKIFSSVDHGLCLLTPDLKIGQRISDATYKIFEKEKLAGFSFIDLMRPLISEKDLNTLKSYLKLQFDGKTMSKQLDKYNPLKNVEMSMSWDGSNFNNKFVGFEFERIVNNKKVELVLVTITDITDRVVLQKNLEQSEAEQRMQSELIYELVRVDNASFRRVISQAERSVDEINELLKKEQIQSGQSVTTEVRTELIDKIFNKVHNIKGNASVVGLNKLAGLAHKVEDELTSLKSESNLTGDAILGSLMQLSTMRELISDYQDTQDEFLTHFSGSAPSLQQKEEDNINTQLTQFTTEVCEKIRKKT